MKTATRNLPRSASRSRQIAVACVLFAVLVAVTPLLPFPFETGLTVLLAALPIIWAIRRSLRGEFDWFEVVLLLGTLQLFYFGIGALWLKSNPQYLFSLSLVPYLTPALALGALGGLAMFAGYAVVGSGFGPSPIAKLRPRRLTFFAVVLLIGFVGQGAMMAQERLLSVDRAGISTLASTFQQLAPLFYYAWVLLWLEFWSGHLDRRGLLLLGLAATPLAGIVLLGRLGGKEVALVLVSLPALAFWYARRRLPWRTMIVVALVGVFVVFPFYNTYRSVDTRLNASRRVSETVAQTGRWGKEEFLDNSVTAFMKRMSVVYCVGAILRDVPEAVPYRYGDTLILAPIGIFVPRFLWPDKPSITIGREFGETFQLVNPVDELTQIAPTFVGEFYWNFDIPGVVIGMFAFGCLMRVFYERFGSGTALEPLRKACYLGLLPDAVHFEGNAAAMLGGMTKTLVVLWAITLLARRAGWLKSVGPTNGTSPPRLV